MKVPLGNQLEYFQRPLAGHQVYAVSLRVKNVREHRFRFSLESILWRERNGSAEETVEEICHLSTESFRAPGKFVLPLLRRGGPTFQGIEATLARVVTRREIDQDLP